MNGRIKHAGRGLKTQQVTWQINHGALTVARNDMSFGREEIPGNAIVTADDDKDTTGKAGLIGTS